MRTRVAIEMHGPLKTYHMVRAFVEDCADTPCGRIVYKRPVAEGQPFRVGDVVVACLVCGDEPFGTCEACGKYGRP